MKKLLGLLLILAAVAVVVWSVQEANPAPTEPSVPQTTTEATQPPTTNPPTTEPTTQPPTETVPPTDPQVEALRPYRNLGVCRGLDEAHTFVLFFLDDLSSSWSGEEIAAFNGLYFYPAMDFLQTQGEAWGMEVNRDSFTR